MEYHDFYMFHQGGNGRPRVALKSSDPEDFWVDHLSEFEHFIHRRKAEENKDDILLKRTRHVEREACGRARPRWPREFEAPIAVIPFWGGLPETDAKGKVVGNAHSTAAREIKLMQLNATICGIRSTLNPKEITIGVATLADFNAVSGVMAVRVEQFDVDHGAYLAFALLRATQDRIERGDVETTSVFFSEADQVLHSRLPPFQLIATLGQHVYVAPNRLHSSNGQGGHALFTHAGLKYQLGQNTCTNGHGVATSLNRTLLPQVDEPPKGLRQYRGKANSAPASRSRRPPISSTELNGTTPRTVYYRCWDDGEKRSRAWFAHISTLLKADVEHVKVTGDLRHLTEPLVKVKFARSWNTWTLKTDAFSLGRPPIEKGTTFDARKKRQVLGLMPTGHHREGLSDSLGSVAAVAEFVVVGVCNDDDPLDVGVGASLRWVDCPKDNTKWRSAMPLLISIRRSLLGKNDEWPGVGFILFVPLGDVVTIFDLSGLTDVVATTIFVIAKEEDDHSPCQEDSRDWVVPLGGGGGGGDPPPHRPQHRRYFFVPR